MNVHNVYTPRWRAASVKTPLARVSHTTTFGNVPELQCNYSKRSGRRTHSHAAGSAGDGGVDTNVVIL